MSLFDDLRQKELECFDLMQAAYAGQLLEDKPVKSLQEHFEPSPEKRIATAAGLARKDCRRARKACEKAGVSLVKTSELNDLRELAAKVEFLEVDV